MNNVILETSLILKGEKYHTQYTSKSLFRRKEGSTEEQREEGKERRSTVTMYSLFPQLYWEIFDIHHCVRLTYRAWWFHLHILCIVITIDSSSHTDTIKRRWKEEIFFSYGKNPWFTLFMAPVYPSAALALVLMLYIISLVLVCLTTSSLCHLTTFLQFPLLLPLPLLTTCCSLFLCFSLFCFRFYI